MFSRDFCCGRALIMSQLPFVITQEAEAHIERVFLDAQKNLQLLAMERVLHCAESCSWTDPKGRGGWYPFPHVSLIWVHSNEVVDDSEYNELELVGFRVFIHQDCLERLHGQRIVLDKGKGRAGRDVLAVKRMATSGNKP